MSSPDPAPCASVVIVEDAGATQAFQPNPERVRRLVERGLTNLTGLASGAAAWRSLLSTQDVVGIKVFSGPGPNIGTRPAVVEAVVEGLLAAQLPPHHIIIWDKQLDDLRRAGFADLAAKHGVRVAGAAQAGWDEKVFYDELPLLGHLVHGDLEFGSTNEKAGRKSYVSKLLTKEITKIIHVSPLLNHNSAGVCGNLYGLAMGSVDNSLRFEGDPSRLAQAVPVIYALPVLGDRVVLNIVDALVVQYEGERVGRLHYSTALNQIRFSTDPVALDVLSLQELARRRVGVEIPKHDGKTNELDLCRTASLLQIGISDPQRIQVETLK